MKKIELFGTHTVPKENTVVALGNFDGVHLGHKELISKVLEKAQKHDLVPAVWSFESYSPKCRGVCITTAREREALLFQMGIKTLFLSGFEQTRDMGCEEFIVSILKEKCGAKIAVIGFNFRFGKGAAGDADTFCSLCIKHGIEPIVCPAVYVGGECVSSTLIRGYLAGGDMERAAELLGRPYYIELPVLQGQRLGVKMGFPTINQVFPAEMAVPRHGVYACFTELGGVVYPAVTDIGVRPTVSGHGIRCETHIIGYSGDLYGDRIRVSFRRFIRPEIKFESLDALARQIGLDVEEAKKGL